MHITRSLAAPSSSSNRKQLWCKHCNQECHLVDWCYYKIGFSMGHKWHGKNVKPRNKKLVAQNVELKKEPTNEGPHSQLSNTNKSWLCFKIKMVMINHSQTRQVYSHPFAIIYNMVHIQHYIVLWIVEQHIPYHISHILTIKLRHVTI